MQEKRDFEKDLISFCKTLLPEKSANIDYEFAKEIILLSKVEHYLLSNLNSRNVLMKWLPGFLINHQGVGGYTRNPYGKFTWTSFQGWAIDTRTPYWNDNFISFPVKTTNKSQTEMTEIYIKELRKILALNSDVENKIKEIFKSSHFKLIDLFAFINFDISDDKPDTMRAGFQLASSLGIGKNDFMKSIQVGQNSLLKDAYITAQALSAHLIAEEANLKFEYNFRNADESIIYRVKKFNYWGNEIILPFTNWVYELQPSIFSFHIFPKIAKHPLFNLDHIAFFKNAKIILTEHLDIVRSLVRINKDSKNELLFSSWYGGIENIDNIDWSPLKGRSVYYLLWNNDSFNEHQRKQRLKTAKKLYYKFHADSNMHFKIMIVDTFNNDVIELDDERLINILNSNNISAPKNLVDYQESLINSNISQKNEMDFLINPVLKKNSLTVLYAPAGLGKTWLGLSMGLAMANGTDVFKDWEGTRRNQNVLYILGEMDKNEIENRIYDLNKIYLKNPQNANNFLAIRKDYDLATREDQNAVEEATEEYKRKNAKSISVLVLDNLTTLVKNGENKSNWERFFKWIKKLQRKKMTILLIHHANRQGKHLGTGAIKNQTDFMIRLYQTDELEERLRNILTSKSKAKDIRRKKIRDCLAPKFTGKGLVIYLDCDKSRSLPLESIAPLKAVLNLDSTLPSWKVEKVNYEALLSEYNISMTDLKLSILDEDQETKEITKNTDVDLSSASKLTEYLAYEKWNDIPEAERRELLIYLLKLDWTTKKIASQYNVSVRKIAEQRKITKTKKEDLIKEGILTLKSK